MTTDNRLLSPYERTQLAKYGVDEKVAQENSTTPVEYLTGKVDFGGFVFQVSPAVLIPRPETEEFVAQGVEVALQRYKLTHQPLQIVDVGTGCGAIAICVSAKLQQFGIPHRMIATDISQVALDIAKLNEREILINQLQLQSIEIEQRNLLVDWPTDAPFDLILANLPYVPQEWMNLLEPSVKDHEPLLAIDGGKEGFELIPQLLDQARSLLNPQGIVLLEINYTHPPLLQQYAQEFFKVYTWQSPISKCTFAQLELV